MGTPLTRSSRAFCSWGGGGQGGASQESQERGESKEGPDLCLCRVESPKESQESKESKEVCRV